MNLKTIVKTIMAAFLILAACSSFALADTEITPAVTLSYSMEPEVLMPGDTGTITITMQKNAYIANAAIEGNEVIEILGESYTDVGLVGPGDTLELTFNVKAKDDAPNGVHFLDLEITGGSTAYDFNSRIPVKIDDRDLKLIISDLPSTLMNEVSSVNVEVVNQRPNEVNSVIVSPEAEGIVFSPSEVFIGAIPGGNKSTATFFMNTMNSDSETSNVSFTVSYFNGDNFHNAGKTTRQVDIIDQNSLIFTSIEMEKSGNKYTFSGDLNNFGTTDAKNVIVSIPKSESVVPVQPYAKYFIGTLEADDFSSFELSASVLSGDVSSIPVLIEFRDPDNAYISIEENIAIDGQQVFAGNSEEDSGSSLALWAVAGIFAIAIVALIGYSWKKRRDEAEAFEDEEIEPSGE
ncbi:hypothetical protein HWN40_02320 [Methanolobus zinderi]|uniref:S-layer protein n=1 Tax=Methanolobus zinderi TaxID=536044 RepID=A0A7D5I2A9_9EURY|nr:hypothetical protein HWN40_02320 [Methanolobus zinderi]